MTNLLRTSAVVLACSSVLALSFSGRAAFASTSDETAETLAAISGVLSNAAVLDDAPGEILEYTAPETKTSVELPADSAQVLTMSNALSGELGVELPFSEEAASRDDSGRIPTYENGNGSRTVPVVKSDGSVQITTILDSTQAPTRFDYTFDAGPGSYLEPVDGLTVVRHADGGWAAGIAPAWAVDANGASVPTHYEIDGSVLTQVVEHSAGEFAYPIVADPYLGQALISRVDVGSSSGKPTYAVVKTAYGNNVAMGYTRPGVVDGLLGATVMRGEGWKEAIAKRPAMNSTTIKQQFDCHTVYAPSKNPWNLEAFRAQNANWGVNPRECNW
ncbi:DUF2599 domain-containing protein [Leifsonia aquatica]|uniref:DUF2599 domain-containing protein n=1 Tax=Leifsonia aquatica TaxID=144185 RepID=UPI0038220376